MYLTPFPPPPPKKKKKKKKKSETPKQTALLLFQDTLEILVEHDGSSSGQKNKFLAPLVSFALNERILASTNEQTVVLEKPSQTEESSEFVYLKCQRFVVLFPSLWSVDSGNHFYLLTGTIWLPHSTKKSLLV